MDYLGFVTMFVVCWLRIFFGLLVVLACFLAIYIVCDNRRVDQKNRLKEIICL